MSRTRIVVLAVTGTLTIAAACGSSPQQVTSGAPELSSSVPIESNEGGFAAPSHDGNELAGVATSYDVTGSVSVADNGCWYVTLNESNRLIAFPPGWDFVTTTSTALQGPSGMVIGAGDDIDGTVRFTHEDDLPADGKWANYMAFCGPAVAELAVFDELTTAHDPSVLTMDDHRAAIEHADMTENWPCGRGWAGSTADERIGIVIYQVDDTQPTPGPIVQLPDAGWIAEVIVGKHLFTSNCNDAIEEWMPTAQIFARYPVSATITIADEVPANTDPPATVRAALTDGSVLVGGAAVPLGDLQLRNEAYNAFAG